VTPVQAPLPTFLVQLGRIFFSKCVMTCIQMAGVLIGGQPPTHRVRVLIGSQPQTHQAMVSPTIISFLYTFILILLNKYILFFIEIKANRVNRKNKIHIFCLIVALMLGYTLGATMMNLPLYGYYGMGCIAL